MDAARIGGARTTSSRCAWNAAGCGYRVSTATRRWPTIPPRCGPLVAAKRKRCCAGPAAAFLALPNTSIPMRCAPGAQRTSTRGARITIICISKWLDCRASVVSRKFLVLQSSPCASMQGVVRREYWAYSQGPQRGSGAHGELPKGAPHGACGRVAPLGNGAHHSLRGRALPQTPWDALKCHKLAGHDTRWQARKEP